jgi:thymidylate kinase
MRYFYLTGPDGCGKTSFINEIERELSNSDICVATVWLRSPKILSKPLMALCRMIKLTTYETRNGIKYGDHQFHRSKIVSWLFPWLQLIDFKIKYFFIGKKMRHADIVLFDRFSIDTLADLMADTERFTLHKSFIGKSFINLIPSGTLTAFINVEEMIIRKRKSDTLYDPQLTKKLKIYNILANDLNLTVINNNGAFDEVKKEILTLFRL